MKKAEEAALRAYPPIATVPRMVSLDDGKPYDPNKFKRDLFINGYEQAEKVIISLIESRIGEILGDAQPAPVLRAELRELIKIIKEK